MTTPPSRSYASSSDLRPASVGGGRGVGPMRTARRRRPDDTRVSADCREAGGRDSPPTRRTTAVSRSRHRRRSRTDLRRRIPRVPRTGRSRFSLTGTGAGAGVAVAGGAGGGATTRLRGRGDSPLPPKFPMNTILMNEILSSSSFSHADRRLHFISTHTIHGIFFRCTIKRI